MRDISASKSIQFWVNKRCGSETTVRRYMRRSKLFFEWAGTHPDKLVATWKKVKYDYRLREQFIDEWTEKLENYIFNNLENYTPLSRLNELGMVESFFKAHKIPVEPDKPKHPFVKFHNRDITKKEIRRIVEHTTLRNKTFFLMMAESGLRPYTLVQLRYKHIKKDFEANTVPMRIELPSELLKDRVEARWTFIGEDAFKVLKAYLKPRLPLQDENLIFLSKRSDTKHDFLLPQTFTNIFGRVALKLRITETTQKGKPKPIRLYCLRKFFNNNLRYEGFNTAYREFWMGHKTTQTHYISRDPEYHRKEYKKGYEQLRIQEPATPAQLTEIREQFKKKDQEIQELRDEIKHIKKYTDLLENLQFAGNRELTQEEKNLMLERVIKILWKESPGQESSSKEE
jgi:integrase